MENKAKLTLIAAVVCAQLSSAATAANNPRHQPKSNALPGYDFNAAKANSLTKAKLKPAKSSQKTRKSGDQYDSILGVNTILWADNKQNTAPIAKGVLTRQFLLSESARYFAKVHGHKHGANAQAITQAQLFDSHDTGRGAIISRFQQKHNDIEVVDRRLNVITNQDLELVATTGYFSKAIAPKIPLSSQFELTAGEAIAKALADLGDSETTLKPSGKKANYNLFEVADAGQFKYHEKLRAKKVYYPTAKKLIPAYYIESIYSKDNNSGYQAYGYIVSATTGNIMRRRSLTHDFAFNYRVFADSEAPYQPYDSPMGNDLTPHPTGLVDDTVIETQVEMNLITIENSGISTNDPWLAPDAQVTTGNNVDVYTDSIQPEGYTPPGQNTDGIATLGDFRATVTSEGTFDYTYNQNEPFNTTNNTSAAMVNAFYIINQLHDTYYSHGFKEADGTAQINNYGRGGVEGDPFIAQVQAYSGRGFAEITIPDDGNSPRLRMYPRNHSSKVLSVGDSGRILWANSSWSPPFFDLLNVGAVVMTDGGTDSTDGCETPTNTAELEGKIALIQYGNCPTQTKVLNASNHGAIAAVVYNNVENGDSLIQMTGDNSDLVFPAVHIGHQDGLDIIEQIEANNTKSYLVDLDVRHRDQAIDNLLITHEWTHYLTARLTNGGLYENGQGQALAEGWGDFFALVNEVREQDNQLNSNDLFQGIYVDHSYSVKNDFADVRPYYYGTRRAPYTTNMAVNGLTFKHLQAQVPLPDHPIYESLGQTYFKDGHFNTSPDNAGEIWALGLWESYAGLLNRGDLTFAQAKSRMQDYMIAALKITPAAPTFIEARDAVLTVALANDEADFATFLAGFAKRGMGLGSVSPQRYDIGYNYSAPIEGQTGYAGVFETFNTELTRYSSGEPVIDYQYTGTNGGHCDMDDVLDVGETALISMTFKNNGTTPLAGVTVTLTSDADVTFSNGGVLEFGDLLKWHDESTATAEITLNSAAHNERIRLTYTARSENGVVGSDFSQGIFVNRDITKDATRNLEDFESRFTLPNDWSFDTTGAPTTEPWDLLIDVFDNNNRLFGPNNDVESDISALTPVVTVAESGAMALIFDHVYQFEYAAGIAWDGAVIEVSIDGGQWQDVVDAGGTFLDGYDGIINDGSDPATGGYANPILGGRQGFIDFLPEYEMTEERLTFAEGILNGHDVQFRFRIGTDAAEAYTGWLIDNVQFTNITNPPWSSVVEDAGLCALNAPQVTAEPITAVEGQLASITLSATVTNSVGDLSYLWIQTAGPAVTLNDTTGATPVFDIPMVSKDTTLTFKVAVTDDNGTGEAIAQVNIENALAPELVISPPSVDRTYDFLNPELWGGPVSYTLDFKGAETVNLRTADITLITNGLVSGVVKIENGDTSTPTVYIDRIGSIFGGGTMAISVAAGVAVDADGKTSNETQSASFTIEKYYE